jgi:hypothetical protein
MTRTAITVNVANDDDDNGRPKASGSPLIFRGPVAKKVGTKRYRRFDGFINRIFNFSLTIPRRFPNWRDLTWSLICSLNSEAVHTE